MTGQPVVLHLVHWPASGVGAVVGSIISHQRAWGVDSHVVVLDGNLAEAERIGVDAASVLAVDVRRKPLRSLRKLSRLCRTVSPAVVHTHSLTPMAIGRLVGGSSARIRTVHSPYPYLTKRSVPSGAKRAIESRLVRSQDAVVLVSDDLRATVQAALCPACQVVTIPNGVEVRQEPSVVGAGLGPTERVTPTIVAVGRLSSEKGFDVLLDAVALLRRGGRPVALKIAGEGRERGTLANQVSALSLDDSVQLLGFVSDVTELLRGADIMVSSSRFEGLALAGLQALSVGTPVVATPTGGLSEIVRESGAGVISEGFSSEAIAEAVCRCLDNLEAIRARARVTRGLVAERYGARRMAHDYLNLYRRIIGGNRSGS
jgi:glycosyltransferase involved in cell wall biosynthesis